MYRFGRKRINMPKTLTKAHLVDKIINRNGCPKNFGAEILNSLLEIMKSTLKTNDFLLLLMLTVLIGLIHPKAFLHRKIVMRSI